MCVTAWVEQFMEKIYILNCNFADKFCNGEKMSDVLFEIQKVDHSAYFKHI